MGFVSRLALLAALLVASLAVLAPPPAAAQLPCGILRPCPPPPPPPDPGPSDRRFFLTVEPQQIVYDPEDPEEVRIRGLYTVDSGPAFATVEIVAVPWPYTSEHVISRNGTFNGSFGHSVHIGVNTRYYARTDTNPDPAVTSWFTSPVHQVTIYPKFDDFDVDFVKRRVVRMEFSYDFPFGTTYPLAGTKVHWYIVTGKKKRPKVRKVARSRARMSEEHVLSGRVRTKLPKGRYKFRAAFCLDVPVGVDIGVGEPVQEPCP